MLHGLLAVAGRLVPELESIAVDPVRLVAAALTWLLVGCGFVAVGTGSVRRRRWACPLMTTLAWIWLLTGLLTLMALPAALDSTAEMLDDAALVSALRWTVGGVVAVFGVAAPAAFVWAYRDPAMLATCQANDPRAAWTDRCPPPVSGLAVALGACGLLFLPMALEPTVPLFGRLIGGWPGGLLTLAVAGLSLLLAHALYRRTLAGWWGTLVFLTLLGASTLVTQLVAPPEAWREALGPGLGDSPLAQSPLAMGATIAVTAGSAIYLLRIRKYWERG
jgi:hypothetical protein